MSHAEKLNIGELLDIATRLAPAFRDKFDFSDPKDHDKMAALSFEQAKAMRKRANELYDEALIKDAQDAQKSNKEQGGIK